jgi:hypothetical protein
LRIAGHQAADLIVLEVLFRGLADDLAKSEEGEAIRDKLRMDLAMRNEDDGDVTRLQNRVIDSNPFYSGLCKAFSDNSSLPVDLRITCFIHHIDVNNLHATASKIAVPRGST